MDIFDNEPSSNEVEELDVEAWWPLSSLQSPAGGYEEFTEHPGFGSQWPSAPDKTDANALVPKTQTELRSKRRGGRIYTGCLTCRNRKIKCDGRRPICLNCERSRRYVCKGYLNRHGQVEINSSETTQIRRDMISTQESCPSRPPRNEEVGRSHESMNNGRSNPTRSNKPAPTGNPSESMQAFDPIESEQLMSIDESVIGRDIQLFDLDAILEFQDELNFQKHLQADNEDDGLLIHYRDVVSHLMMPTIDASRNPWLHIYVPMALIEPPAAGQLALRHALMSVAAYHLSQIELEPRQSFLKRAVRHKDLAMNILRDNLHSISSDMPRIHTESFLAAAMALTSTNVFGDDRSNYNLNLRMGKQIIFSAGGADFWKANARSMVLYQIFRCYNIVAATTAHAMLLTEAHTESIDTPDEVLESDTPPGTINVLTEDADSSAGLFQVDRYVLETTFGIHVRTIAFLYRTVKIGARIREVGNSDRILPVNLGADIDCLEKEMDNFQRDSKALGNANSDIPSALQLYPMVDSFGSTSQTLGYQPSLPKLVSDELIRNHQWAFQFAVNLYFHRIIYPLNSHAGYGKQEGKGRDQDGMSSKQIKSTLHGHQKIVAKIFDHLENIDCLTRTRNTRPANILWPGFIGAVEAVDVELRQRALIWLQKTAQRGCGNAISAKELAMEVWRRVDRQMSSDDESNISLGSVDWRVVMSELGFVIMLT